MRKKNIAYMKLLSHISLSTFAALVIGIKAHLLGNNLLFMKIHADFLSLNLKKIKKN